MKGICLTFNLVPRLVVYDKYQLRDTDPHFQRKMFQELNVTLINV